MNSVRAALVAVLALLAVGAQALGPCPGTPLEACDFFFAGSADTIPTYKFKGNDKPLSTFVYSSKNPKMQVSGNIKETHTYTIQATVHNLHHT